MPAPAVAKILRVGVIQAGKIVEERLLKKREDVTVGHEGRNTIVVPDSNLPASLPLFEYRDHKYFLVFTEQMDGRVRVGESDLDFGALKSQKLAQKRGPVYVYPLGDNAKGKVTVGEVTLLFQFVAPPPEPPKPEPPGIKGSLFPAADRLFFGVLAGSMLFHFSGAAYVISQPTPVERELSLEELPDRFAKVLIPVKPPEPEPTAQADAADEGAKKEDKEEAAKKSKPAGGGGPTDKAELQQKVAQKGLLKILGSVGSGGGSAFEDVLGSGTGAGDISSALAGAGGVELPPRMRWERAGFAEEAPGTWPGLETWARAAAGTWTLARRAT